MPNTNLSRGQNVQPMCCERTLTTIWHSDNDEHQYLCHVKQELEVEKNSL